MFKKLMLLSVLTTLTACETINQAKQCDPEKNYIISNPQAIDEYKNLDKEGRIKSIYYKNQPTKGCDWDTCVQFDNKKFDFIEKYFNDSKREGVYTIYQSDDLSRKDCMPHNSAAYSLENKCFYTIKNKNNEIKSTYMKSREDTNKQIVIKFYNLKNNILLLESSYQPYSTNAIGAVGAGFCDSYSNNNPHYETDSVSIGR